MDDLEGKHDVKADQRVDQFVRLRDAIEERASRKFFERPVEAQGPVVLRSNDFSSSRLRPRSKTTTSGGWLRSMHCQADLILLLRHRSHSEWFGGVSQKFLG